MDSVESILPVGKLPADLLARLLALAPTSDPEVVLGPGIGLDCAILKVGERLLALKSDPITFAADQIGWYAVQINANDIATSGATPRWFMATLLLPEGKTTPERVGQIAEQLAQACRDTGVTLIGGHTEITTGLSRPILIGTMIGEVEKEDLVTPRGACPGDRLLLTKGIPIEATALLAREFPEKLEGRLTPEEIQRAQGFLLDPGISILKDARLARKAGKITAMHDPTEGGLATALWELSEACGRSLYFDPAAAPVPPLAAKVCQVFGLDPLAAIASGALLLTAPPADAVKIRQALEENGIACAEIGAVEDGPASVWAGGDAGRERLPRPVRDEVGRYFEENP